MHTHHISPCTHHDHHHTHTAQHTTQRNTRLDRHTNTRTCAAGCGQVAQSWISRHSRVAWLWLLGKWSWLLGPCSCHKKATTMPPRSTTMPQKPRHFSKTATRRRTVSAKTKPPTPHTHRHTHTPRECRVTATAHQWRRPPFLISFRSHQRSTCGDLGSRPLSRSTSSITAGIRQINILVIRYSRNPDNNNCEGPRKHCQPRLGHSEGIAGRMRSWDMVPFLSFYFGCPC